MELKQILYSERAYLLTARLRGVGGGGVGGGLFNLVKMMVSFLRKN